MLILTFGRDQSQTYCPGPVFSNQVQGCGCPAPVHFIPGGDVAGHIGHPLVIQKFIYIKVKL